MLVLVADVENALLCSGDQTANDHSLDQQVRQMLHDEAIFDRARLALIGVADHVLLVVSAVANDLPLVAGRKSRASHSSQATGLQLRDHTSEISSLNQTV